MKSSELPKLSIIIPTKNSEQHISDALDSVQAQTFQAFEIVIVDGSSSDATVRLAEKYPKIRIVAQGTNGLASAWNEGIDAARGEFIAFLDSDDIWLPRKLEAQIDCFAKRPETQCVVGKVKFFLEAGHQIPLGFKAALLEQSHVAYMPGTAMMRRSLFDRIGKFEDRWKIAGDLVWFDKLKKSDAPIEVLDVTLLHKRIHENNLSYTSFADYRSELLEHVKESLAKRRAATKVKGQ